MFADDLALVSKSDHDLQSMLNIVTLYANSWRYKLNSSIFVIGEQDHGMCVVNQYQKRIANTTWEFSDLSLC